MKKNYLLLILPLLFAACQPKPTSTVSTGAAAPSYPYKIKHPDYWDMDTSHSNTMVALNALKAYETKDTALMKKCIADSIIFNYDNGTFKGTNAQFVKMAVTTANSITDDKLEIKDWEPVVSKDKKEEWVTVWYTQKWTTAKGVADSVSLINDFKLEKGKIAKLDEYVRHFKSK